MSEEQLQVLGLVVQVVAIVVALGASVVALVTSAADRKNNRDIATAARAEAARVRAEDVVRQQLATELEYAVRLSVNTNHGGSSDPLVRKQLGAEALALVALLGPGRVPGMWQRMVSRDPDELRAELEREETPQFMKDKIESALAVQDVMRRFQQPPSDR